MTLAKNLLILGCAASSLVSGATLPKTQAYTANFTTGDDCTPDAPGVCRPVSVPGLYDELIFSNLRPYLTPQERDQNGGIVSHSREFGACFGPECIDGGSPVAVSGNQASLSANYDGSTVKSFNASSFYFGCTASNTTTFYQPGDPPTTSTFTFYNPITCKLTIKGYRKTKSQLPGTGECAQATATFTYIPKTYRKLSFTDALLLADMQQFTLPKSFAKLRTLVFEINNKTVVPDTSSSKYGPPSGYLDDISFVVTHSRK